MADQDRKDQDQREKEERVLHNAYSKVGPQSIDGVEASDLPDRGRGSVDTSIGKVVSRQTPNMTGETSAGNTGMRGTKNAGEAEMFGGRKKA